MGTDLVQYHVKSSEIAKPLDEELLIVYRPFHNTEKWVENRIGDVSGYNSWKPWIALGFVIAFFVFGGPPMVFDALNKVAGGPSLPDVSNVASTAGSAAMGGAVGAIGSGLASTAINSAAPVALTSAKVLEWFAIAAGAGILGVFALVQRKPTHILLNADGIAWEWQRTAMNIGRMIPWAAVTHIGLSYPENRTSPQDCLLTFSTAKNPRAMEIKLGGIATTADRENFLKSLERWAPDVSKDAEIYDVLTPPPDHSYTELWLQALSAPPKRERLTPLNNGAILVTGNYTIVEQLGVGGQGTAYLTKTTSGESVVLKEFILPVFVDINVRRQALERMQNEVQMLKKLDHDRIVKLKDFFIEDHRGYLVLELIDGDSLRTLVNRNGKMSEAAVVSLMEQMCDMLEYLHSLSPPVVHRDFTPDNLILGHDGILKLVDFNVAQQKEATSTGTVVGKHAYIPPEQFRGKPCSQSDIYAMGASVFFLLSGKDPEPITSSHPKEECPEVSNGLDIIIARATALDTSYRYQSASEIRKELQDMVAAAT